MDVILYLVGSEQIRYNDVKHMSYTYHMPDIMLIIVNNDVHIYDMCDVMGVTVLEK